MTTSDIGVDQAIGQQPCGDPLENGYDPTTIDDWDAGDEESEADAGDDTVV